jgi:hypothetical protein
MSISFSLRNPLFTSASKSSVFALDWGVGEMSMVMNPGQI